MTGNTTCCSCAESLAALKAAHRLACEAVEVGKRDLRLLADRLDTAIAERDQARDTAARLEAELNPQPTKITQFRATFDQQWHTYTTNDEALKDEPGKAHD